MNPQIDRLIASTRDPMTEAECHRLHGVSLLEGEGCRCFQADGFLECPASARRVLNVDAPTPEPAPEPSPPTKRVSMAGDFCQDCGSPNMTRAGTCMVCRDCGSTSGGCS